MNAIEKQIEEIFNSKCVFDINGVKHDLGSNIDKNEGEFLCDIIKKNDIKNTIEVGCAMGISSLFICSALYGQKDSYHTIIDPMQSTDWSSIGISNLNSAGVDFYKLIEEPSEIALPQLLSEKKQYDMGFIDGWHTFDHTLLDFFYLNRLIKVGGIIVIDDVSFPAIKKAMRYVLNYPAYELIGTVKNKLHKSIKRYLYENTIPGFFTILAKIFPVKMRHKLFSDNVLNPSKTKALNASMIALRKIKEDDRRWDWFESF